MSDTMPAGAAPDVPAQVKLAPRALRAALRLASAVVGASDLSEFGRLSPNNAAITAADMRRDLALVASFVDALPRGEGG